jgi:hypothetical protein
VKRIAFYAVIAATAVLNVVAANGGDIKSTKEAVPPAETWRLKLSMPIWLAGIEGDIGVNGNITQVNVDPGDILRRLDMVATVRAEASKGRFGVMTDFAYSSASDGIGSDRAIKKLDIQLDQVLADVGLRWRLIETPRYSLDVIGGVRYTNNLPEGESPAERRENWRNPERTGSGRNVAPCSPGSGTRSAFWA